MAGFYSLRKGDFSKILTSGVFFRLSFGNLWYLPNFSDLWIDQAILGLIINKKTGNSVIRHKISRQIRNYFYQKNPASNSAFIIRIKISCDKKGLTRDHLQELDDLMLAQGWLHD